MAGTSTQARRPSPATFWPFSVRAAILITPVLLALFLILLGIVRATAHWPDRRLDGWLLLGIVVLSLVPLFLVLLGSVAGPGGSIEAFGVKLQWVEKVGITDITVSPTLGLQPHAFLNDSASEILATLRQATNYSAAIVDLGDGQEWLETRLLVLSAGAAQSGRPAAIVFVATVGGVRQAFQGWAPPLEIVRGLVTANPNFASAYENAVTTAKQWEMAFPSSKATLPWRGDEFDNNSNTAFHDQRRNELALAEFLASSISEPSDKPDHISVVRLATLFTPFLRKASVDESEQGDAWISTVLGATDPYLAITRQGRYMRLIPREAAVNDIISTLIGRAT